MTVIPVEPDWWRARDRDGDLWFREPDDDGNVWRVDSGDAPWTWRELVEAWGPITCADDEHPDTPELYAEFFPERGDDGQPLKDGDDG